MLFVIRSDSRVADFRRVALKSLQSNPSWYTQRTPGPWTDREHRQDTLPFYNFATLALLDQARVRTHGQQPVRIRDEYSTLKGLQVGGRLSAFGHPSTRCTPQQQRGARELGERIRTVISRQPYGSGSISIAIIALSGLARIRGPTAIL